jgi:tetratricopeptide (TPR) repeat protein
MFAFASAMPRALPSFDRIHPPVDRRTAAYTLMADPGPSGARWLGMGSERLLVLAIVLFAAWPGCRLPGRRGPIPESLAACRQYTRQGVAAAERGQYGEAEALLSKAVDACPVDGEARRHYAEALWKQGSHAEAITQMREALRLAGKDPVMLGRLARMHLEAGHATQASQLADQALDLDPKLASAWSVRGHLSRRAGRPREALADYQRALGYAPADRETLRDIAELYRELGQPQRALASLQSLSDTYPPGEQPAEVSYLTGLAHLALGRAEDAEESLAAAAARGKPSPEVLYQLAEAHLLAGHPALAADAARRALQLRPEHGPSRQLLDRIETAQRGQAAPRG